MKRIMLLLSMAFVSISTFAQKPDSTAYGVFSFTHELTLPGQPELIFDAATGDISGWWDHTFSTKPQSLYIEAKPGGGFYEIFDDSGDGVLHARVTAAHRGKILRFIGPLGLAGNAIELVCTYTFETVGSDSTKMQLDVHAAGEVHPGWPEIVEKVWLHFLDEQFKSYIESGKHLKE
jgi:hypothetical protein